MKSKPAPNIQGIIEKQVEAGFIVTDTVAWKGPQHRSFSLAEIKAGAAERWLKERR